MRVLHVVTIIDPAGSYGGPARVALNQAAELRARGHEVTVAAATRGFAVAPREMGGVPVHLFPARRALPGTGFAGICAPAMLRWFARRSGEFDVVHVHFGRDLVVLPLAAAARRRRIPFVAQTHGMVGPSEHPLATPIDWLWTRSLLRSAGAVLHLTPSERTQLLAVAGSDLALRPLRNGVPASAVHADGATTPDVLFAARLHRRKRPVVFVELAHRLLAEGIDARFTLIGPDEGEAAAVRASIGDESRIRWLGPVSPDDVTSRMSAASIFVLPSVGEPYPMAVLEAMSVGLPVVVTDDCSLAPEVSRTGSGMVTSTDVPAIADAVRTLLTEPAIATRLGENARTAAEQSFGMRAVGDSLLQIYSHITGVAA